MNLRTVGIATVVFALSALTYAGEGQNTDPRSVLKRYIEAQMPANWTLRWPCGPTMG